jgi:hypothetical protein
MVIDKVQFTQVVAEAKSNAASAPRWIAAIDKAADGLLSGKWIVTELANCVAITTESDRTYFANGSCQCEAFRRGQPCKHRSAARLIELYNEIQAARRVSFADVPTGAAISHPKGERAELIADIKAVWSRKHQHEHLADALMSRFSCNKLEMLDIDFLRRIQVALE